MSKHDIGALTAPQKAALTQMRDKDRTPLPAGKGDTATEYTHLQIPQSTQVRCPHQHIHHYIHAPQHSQHQA